MANPKLFNTRHSAVPAVNARNEAGGRAYAFSGKHALAQYAATGCFNQTYYATAEEQLQKVVELANRLDPAFVAKTAVFCRLRGHMKDMPALLCAVLAKRDTEVLKKVFDRVIDDGKMLRNFVQMVRGGVAGRKSLGTAPKRLVQGWLDRRTDDQVFRASVGQNPSLADVVKMVHPRPSTPQRSALYAWLCDREHNAETLPPLVRAFEAFKQSRDSKAVPDVPFQMLTALDLTPAHWAEIAKNAPWQMTRMNLNTFARHGVFADRKLTKLIANRLRNPNNVKRARAFPYQLMAAFTNADDTIPRKVREALQDAMEVATRNVPAIDGKVWVLPDVSGSMQSPATGYRKGATSKVRCLDVAALVAACFLRANRDAEVLPFSDDVVPARLNARDTVLTNAEKLAALPSGGTNCSAPLRYMNQRNAKGDLVIFVSDNESWVDSARGGRGTALMAEWEHFRRRNPTAKLVCVDIQPYGTTQAAERADILNIGGFSDQVFEVIGAFAEGKLSGDHWVGVIEQIQL